jgi:bifunctional non-homologous end joining protein LigD
MDERDSDSVSPGPISPAMLWRIPPARSRRPPPAGFIQPARPLLTSTPRSGPEWIHEIKHDGYRLIALKGAGRVVLWSRYATDYSSTFLRIAEAVRALPVDSALLDGEALVLRPDGHSDFAALRTNRGAEQASFVAFDLLQFEGEDWRKLPLEIRRAQLESLVAGVDGITFSEAIEGDGAIVFAHACKLGLEGVISKRLGGVYSSGRCRNWLKVKNPNFERR